MSQIEFHSEILRDVDEAERGNGSAHYFAMERQWNSPYINRFLSADSIVSRCNSQIDSSL